jgi:hypothetical protein
MRLLPCFLFVVCLAVSACGKSQPTNQPAGWAETEVEPEPVAEKPAVNPSVAQAALEALKAQEGKDLRKLGEDKVKELRGTITKLVPNRTYRGFFDVRPWYVWDFRRKGGQPLWLLFEATISVSHPGYTDIRLTLLDQVGNVISETNFGTGWRCYLQDVKLEAATKERFPIIVLEQGPTPGPGPDYAKQYYGWVGGRFDLVRLEDSKGIATRTDYYIKHFQCGPPLPKQTEAAWEADLLSGNRLKVLRALTWLGGSHWDLRAGDPVDNQHEEVDAILLVRNVRAREKVIARLKELAMSQDQWLKEAATLALATYDLRF